MKWIYVVIVLFLLCRSDVIASHGQNKSIAVIDNIVVNGTMISGIGSDSTMANATNVNIPTGKAIKQYTDTTFKQIKVALLDTAITLRNNIAPISKAALAITSIGSGAPTYNTSTGIFNMPLITYIPSINAATRTINSSTYTVSSTLQATVVYNISISCVASIGSASTGTVLFQYSINGGTSWITAGIVANSNTVSLAIVLNSVTVQTSNLIATIPANALCRLVPTITGTTTITYVSGQEIY